MLKENIEERCGRICPSLRSDKSVCAFAPGGAVGFIDTSSAGDGSRGIAFFGDSVYVNTDGVVHGIEYKSITALQIISSFEDAFADELCIMGNGFELRISDYSLDKFELKCLLDELCRTSPAESRGNDPERQAMIEAAAHTGIKAIAALSQKNTLFVKRPLFEQAVPPEPLDNDPIPVEDHSPFIEETMIEIPEQRPPLPEDYSPAPIPDGEIKWISGTSAPKPLTEKSQSERAEQVAVDIPGAVSEQSRELISGQSSEGSHSAVSEQSRELISGQNSEGVHGAVSEQPRELVSGQSSEGCLSAVSEQSRELISGQSFEGGHGADLEQSREMISGQNSEGVHGAVSEQPRELTSGQIFEGGLGAVSEQSRELISGQSSEGGLSAVSEQSRELISGQSSEGSHSVVSEQSRELVSGQSSEGGLSAVSEQSRELISGQNSEGGLSAVSEQARELISGQSSEGGLSAVSEQSRELVSGQSSEGGLSAVSEQSRKLTSGQSSEPTAERVPENSFEENKRPEPPVIMSGVIDRAPVLGERNSGSSKSAKKDPLKAFERKPEPSESEMRERIGNMSSGEMMSFLSDTLNEINGTDDADIGQDGAVSPNEPDVLPIVTEHIPNEEMRELDTIGETSPEVEQAARSSKKPLSKWDHLTVEPIWGDIYIKASKSLRELCESGKLTMEQMEAELKTNLLSAAKTFEKITGDESLVPKVMIPKITELKAAAADYDRFFRYGEDIAIRAMFFMMYQMLSYADRIVESPETKDKLNDFFRRFGSAGIMLSMLDMRV